MFDLSWVYDPSNRFTYELPQDIAERFLLVLGHFKFLKPHKFHVKYVPNKSIHDGQFDTKSRIVLFSRPPTKLLIAHELTHVWSYSVQNMPKTYEKLTDIFSLSIDPGLIDTPPCYLGRNFPYCDVGPEWIAHWTKNELHSICLQATKQWQRGFSAQIINSVEQSYYELLLSKNLLVKDASKLTLYPAPVTYTSPTGQTIKC